MSDRTMSNMSLTLTRTRCAHGARSPVILWFILKYTVIVNVMTCLYFALGLYLLGEIANNKSSLSTPRKRSSSNK